MHIRFCNKTDRRLRVTVLAVTLAGSINYAYSQDGDMKSHEEGDSELSRIVVAAASL